MQGFVLVLAGVCIQCLPDQATGLAGGTEVGGRLFGGGGLADYFRRSADVVFLPATFVFFVVEYLVAHAAG